YAIGEVPPRVSRKFKKASPSKKESELVSSSESLLWKQSQKEKVDVAHGKGIELLSEVALSRKAQMKEAPSVEKIKPTVTSEGTSDKPGVPDVTKDDSTESEVESWGNDEDDNNDENDSQDTNENESDSESDQHEKEEEVKEDDEEEDEFVHTPFHTNDKDDANLVSKSDDEVKGDEEKGIDDTTNHFKDDVGVRVNELTQTDKEVVQDEETDAEMID
ncbi:hypothetical protein Tco_0762161, partial [Tanacetum coccineum]